MLFNYTLNGRRMLGYTMTQFNITRNYASLVPIVKANYT